MTDRTTILKSATTAVRELISADGSARVVRTWAVEAQEHFGRTAGVPITEQVAVSGQTAHCGVKRHPAPVTRADNTTPAQFQEPMLFTETPAPYRAPYVRNSQTSHDAAEAIDSHSAAQQARVLTAIMAAGTQGLTDDEGEQVTGLEPHSYCPRRIRLVELGRVFKSTLKRPTRTGRAAFVYLARSDVT